MWGVAGLGLTFGRDRCSKSPGIIRRAYIQCMEPLAGRPGDDRGMAHGQKLKNLMAWA